MALGSLKPVRRTSAGCCLAQSLWENVGPGAPHTMSRTVLVGTPGPVRPGRCSLLGSSSHARVLGCPVPPYVLQVEGLQTVFDLAKASVLSSLLCRLSLLSGVVAPPLACWLGAESWDEMVSRGCGGMGRGSRNGLASSGTICASLAKPSC